MGTNREQLIKTIKEKAQLMRKRSIEMGVIAGQEGAHLGPAFSVIEIISTLYFGGILRKDPKKPTWPDRDRFILSKGHGILALYTALAESGYFPIKELDTFLQADSQLVGHPCRNEAIGVECTTGSLGHGLSIGLGIALAAKMDKKDYDVYVIMGDGEQAEGMIWEAATAAKKYKANNLIGIVDCNKLQADGSTKEILEMAPLADKWKTFGWEVKEVDGHDPGELLDAFDKESRPKDKPYLIIANTVKGKGVSFFENDLKWHHRPISQEEAARALKEIEST